MSKNIFIRNVKNEVVVFCDRKAEELSNVYKRKITRNEYINLILEKQMRDGLSISDELIENINEKIDQLINVAEEYTKTNNRLINLVVSGVDTEADLNDERT